MSQLLEILLIVDAALLGLVLIFSLVRFCVVNSKRKSEVAEETKEDAPLSEETVNEEPVAETAEQVEQAPVEEPQRKIDTSEYLTEEDEIVIPRIKVMLIEREEKKEEVSPVVTEEVVETETETQEEVTEEVVEEEIVEPNEENGLVDVVLINEEVVVEDGESEDLVIGGTDRFADLKARVPFNEKLLGSDEKVQGYYDEIYNKFISYRKMHARVSAKGVSFRLGRELVAKITYRGKTMKLHLALDVNAFEEKIYFQKDMGDVKAYAEVPFTVKVKSDRALKKSLELIDALVEKFAIEQKSRYEKVDSIAQLKGMN